MDLNDPRKRLQVLNNSNPSLRVSVSPQKQPQISIAQPKATPQIIVPKTTPNALPQAPAPNQYKAINLDEGKNKTLFGWNAAAVLPKSLEKTYGVSTKDATFNNDQEFLKYFDTRDEEFRRAYVNRMQKDSATDAVASKTLKLLKDSGRFGGNVMDFVEGSNDKLFGGIGRGIVRGTDFVLPGKNTFGLERLADQQDPTVTGTRQYTEAGKAGEVAGTAQKTVFDIASLFAGSGAAEQVASKSSTFTNLVSKLQEGGKISRAAAKALTILPGSLGGSATDVLQTAGRGDEQNVGKSVGIGTAIDLAMPTLGRGLNKGFNLFKGKGSKSFSFVDDLIGETSPESIQKVLGNVDHTVAEYLAGETDPAAIKQVLQQMALDPNIKLPDDVVKRLEEEGISAVRKDAQSQYPAEYNTGDKSIAFRDQADATADNAYHELGHHIYSTKLTPEEKALFANFKGDAYQQAVGRPGYTEADLVSEDFSDFMRKAMNGQLNQVPEEIRPVIQKYAKIAAAEADDIGVALPNKTPDLPAEDIAAIKAAGGDPGTVFHLPQAGVHAKLTPEQAKFLSDEVNNIPFTKGDMPHLTAGDKVRQATKEVTLEELGQMSPNAKKALENADAAVSPNAVPTEVVDDVSKAQTGVVDAPLNAADDVAAKGTGDATQVADTVNANADQAVDRFSAFEPEVKANLEKVMAELDNADTAYKEVQGVRKAEKGARIAQAGSNFDAAGGGEIGFRSKLKSLKGKYSESGFNPIQADEGVQTTILNDIEKSGLRDFEKLNTQNAMRKIWGANPDKPTASDITYIRKYFGDDLADSVKQAVEESPTGWRDNLAQIAGTPRALMATGDLSMGFRQAAPLGTRMPKEWARANKESVKYATSADYFSKEMSKIKGSDYYEVIKDKMKVALTAADESMEEAFAAADIAEKIPGAGRIVKASDRAYSGGLTKLRFDATKKIIDSYGGVDGFLKFFEGNDKAMTDLGEVINTFTGRGGKAGGLVEQHMKTLSTTLFAPRLWAAKLNSLNPAFYARLSPPARKLALQTQASFLTTAGSVLALASAAGASVEWDPRSADFAKVKVGNTRYDILGGLQQNIRLAAQLATGQKINSVTGELATLGDGFTSPTRKDILLQAFENKENPLLSLATQLLEGKDFQGEPLKTTSLNPFENPIGQRLIPLGAQGAYEATKDTGNVAKGVGLNAPGFFGIGVQTYGSVASKDKGVNGMFKGEITPDMVTDKAGNALLDDKGRPVKVNFPKDATELEKQAMIDDKRKAAQADTYRRGLSKEDQALMKLTDDQLESYVESGKIDQDRYDTIKQHQKNIENAESVKIPDGAQSTLARQYYTKYNSLSKDAQKKYLESDTPDETAKTITELLNKERSKGLSEFKPSNAVAKAYAEYEDDINSHPEYTEVDKRNKAKAFQTFTYKLNYNQDQRDIYGEGSSNDVRYLIDQKQISKEDLDSAIKMDDELYNSGLVGSLKFSKKFRKEYGYGLPDGGGYNANPNSGGDGGGDATPKTGITSLLPSFKTASNGGDAPKFSSKRRTTGISFKNVTNPKPIAKPKVTIKL